MADTSEEASDGSDVDIEFEENGDIFVGEIDVLGGGDRNLDFVETSPTDDNWSVGSFDVDDDDFQANWTAENFTARNVRPYTEVGGAVIQHPDEALPCHYFDLIWDEELWQHLVTETNLYAEQERRKTPPPPSAPKWMPVDIPTMKAFVGLCFCMGVLRLPSRNDYWRQKKRMFKTNLNSIMSRDNFNQIWRYLHVQNNEAVPPPKPDRLLKIRWLLNYLNGKFMSLYMPYGDVTIEESMVKFRERLSFRKYLSTKPIKWGIKVWSLCESTTGYMHRFQVYTGKEEYNTGNRFAHRVVTELLGHLQHKSIRVFMDNFYTSPSLFTELHMRGINACGAVQSCRKGLPAELLPKHIRLQKHEFRVAQKDELSYCIWMDTKPILVLSNFHDPTSFGFISRNGQREPVRVPKILQDYQTHKRGVDICDQMAGYYMIQLRSKKWWRRLFFYLLMASAHNAYVIARNSNADFINVHYPTFQDFVEDLAESLIGDVRAGKDAPVVNEVRPAARHDVVRMYEKHKVCVECRAKAGPGLRAGTSKFGCVQCNVPLHLICLTDHIVRANHL